jgi:hypothetical protein
VGCLEESGMDRSVSLSPLCPSASSRAISSWPDLGFPTGDGLAAVVLLPWQWRGPVLCCRNEAEAACNRSHIHSHLQTSLLLTDTNCSSPCEECQWHTVRQHVQLCLVPQPQFFNRCGGRGLTTGFFPEPPASVSVTLAHRQRWMHPKPKANLWSFVSTLSTEKVRVLSTENSGSLLSLAKD